MDAKQLISLFDAHPKAFALIGVRRSERADGGLYNFDAMELPPWAEVETALAQQWVKWVYGAAKLKADEMRLEVSRTFEPGDDWYWFDMKSLEFDESKHPTGLHATLAAIEAALTKEAEQRADQGRFRVMLNDSSDEHFPDWLYQRSFQTEPEAQAWAEEQMKTGRWFGWEVIEEAKEAGCG